MRMTVVILVGLFLLGCSPAGARITISNATVRFPHYSFSAIPNREWRLERPNQPGEVAVLRYWYTYGQIEFTVMRVDIPEELLQIAPPSRIADIYREKEDVVVSKKTTKPGHPGFFLPLHAEKNIMGKKFYTSQYSLGGTERHDIYMYFPRAERNTFFILARFEGHSGVGLYLDKFHQECMEMLGSLMTFE